MGHIKWLPDEKVSMLRALRVRWDPEERYRWFSRWYGTSWNGYLLASAYFDGESILEMGRGLLRPDAVLFPYLKGDAEAAWCNFEELDGFEEVRVGQRCYWRKKEDVVIV